MMKVLALGDLHIQRKTLRDVSIYLQKLRGWLEANPIDLIVILGDTLHTHADVQTECLKKMYEYISLCEVFAKTFVLVGNHDRISNTDFLNENHPFVGWKETHHIVDSVVRDGTFLFVPYVPDGRFQEAIKDENLSNVRCIFAHQLFDGVKMGPIETKGVEEWPLTNPLLVSGHIHDKQHPFPNLYYTGSCMQVSFGERIDHTISLLTFEESNVKIDEIDLHLPKKKTISGTVRNIHELKIPNDPNLSIRLSLQGTAAEIATFRKTSRFKDLVSSGVKVVFKLESQSEPFVPETRMSLRDRIISLSATEPQFNRYIYELFQIQPQITFD